MPEIRSLEELLNQLGDAIAEGDPVQALADHGHPLSATLQRRMEGIDDSRRLSGSQIRELSRKIGASGPISYSTPEASPDVIARLEPGDYDLITSVRMDLVGETLAGLHTTHTIPKEISTAGAPDLVIDVLRNTFTGVPDGESIRVGSLHLTAAPTPVPVDGTDRVILHQPFELDIVRPIGFMFGAAPVRVSSLRGTLRLTLAVSADVDQNPLDPELRITLESIGVHDDPAPGEEFHIEVDPQSPLQPRSASKLDSFATLVGLFVDRELDERLGPFVICPLIRLPFGDDNFLRIRSVDVRAAGDAEGGALVVGLRVGGALNQPGDPDRLVDPFTEAASNFHARVHVELIRNMLAKALDTGELTKQARREDDSARITGADVEFRDDEIRIKLEGKLVDACGFNKDLPFEATRIVRFQFIGDRVRIEQETKRSADNLDKILCGLLTLLEAAIIGVVVGVATSFVPVLGPLALILGIAAALADLATTPFVELAIDEIVGALRGGGGGGPDVSWFFLRDEVPGTELLPEIGSVSMRADSQSMDQFVRVVLVPDGFNTYIYAQFLRRTGLLGQQSTPLADVDVELWDRDVPRPPGDDVGIPLEETRVEFANEKRIVITRTEFIPPAADQRLAREKTNGDGVVRFVLSPSKVRTTAGTLAIHKSVDNLETGQVQESTTRFPLQESRPDIYFLARSEQGVLIDTRFLASGFIINLRSRRVGSADGPLVFEFGGGPVIAPVVG